MSHQTDQINDVCTMLGKAKKLVRSGQLYGALCTSRQAVEHLQQMVEEREARALISGSEGI